MRSLASLCHVASLSMVVEEGEKEKDEEEDEEEEEEHSDDEQEHNDDDGPPPTQTTQLEKRKASKKDWESPSPFHKARPLEHKKKASEILSKNNEDRTSKRGRNK
ncbi:hypothetical protein ZWY2020_049774 [Hordeum vulgare]|nr:hypothetical protein ZWY2020_049774 [Hordeum vulgare]